MSVRSTNAAVLVGLGLILVGACTSSGSHPASNATSTTTAGAKVTASSVVRPTTTAAVAATTAPTVFFPDRDSAVKHLIDAWRANDPAAALKGADPTAVVNLFTQKADGFELYGQQQGDTPTLTDNYRNRDLGYYAQITSERSAKGWRVISVYMSTDG